MERLQVEGGLNSVENDIAKVMKDRQKDYIMIQQLMKEKQSMKQLLNANKIQINNQRQNRNIQNQSQEFLVTQSSNESQVGACRLRISQSPIRDVIQAPFSLQNQPQSVSQSRNIDILAQALSNKENEYQIKLAEDCIKNQKLEMQNKNYFEISKKYSGCQTDRQLIPNNNMNQSIDFKSKKDNSKLYIRLQPVQIDSHLNQQQEIRQSTNQSLNRFENNDKNIKKQSNNRYLSNENKQNDFTLQPNLQQQQNPQIISAKQFLEQNKLILKDVKFKLDNQITKSSGKKQRFDNYNADIEDQNNNEQNDIDQNQPSVQRIIQQQQNQNTNDFNINQDIFSFINNQNQYIEDPAINSFSHDIQINNQAYKQNIIQQHNQDQIQQQIQNNTQSPQFNRQKFESSEYVSFQNTQNQAFTKNNPKNILKSIPESIEKENQINIINHEKYEQNAYRKSQNKKQFSDEDDSNLDEEQNNNVIQVNKNQLNLLATTRKNILAPGSAVSNKGRNSSKQILTTEDQLREQMEILTNEEKSLFKQKCQKSLLKKLKINSQGSEKLQFKNKNNIDQNQEKSEGYQMKNNQKMFIQSVNASQTSSQSAQIQDYQYLHSLKQNLHRQNHQNQ